MIFLKESKSLLALFLIISLNSFSQQLIIKDFQDESIIPNVALHNTLQTLTILSDSNGVINLSSFKQTDSLIFSHVSYEKRILSVNSISQSIVYLYPKTQILSEIIL